MRQLLLIFIFLSANLSFAKILKSRGTAVDKKGKVVYVEDHTSHIDKNKIISITTNYHYQNEKEPFAQLMSDFSDSNYFPYSNFIDKRFDHIEKIEKTKKSKEFLITTKKDHKHKLKNSKYKQKKEIVAGQGLHSFIVENFDMFKKKGFRKKINFFIPVKVKTYTFIIVVKNITEKELVLDVEIKNWFIRLFAPTIKVTYDLATKQLIKYEGLSNIGNLKGKGQNVVITYEYFEPDN